LRSDSDSNAYNTFSTPTTLCSESERNNEDRKAVNRRVAPSEQSKAGNLNFGSGFTPCNSVDPVVEKVGGLFYEF